MSNGSALFFGIPWARAPRLSWRPDDAAWAAQAAVRSGRHSRANSHGRRRGAKPRLRGAFSRLSDSGTRPGCGATVDNYVAVVVRFLTARFGEGPVDLAALQAHDLTGFVLAQAHHLSPKPAQLMVTGLRQFPAFLYQRGQIRCSIWRRCAEVADWRLARVPKYLPARCSRACLL